MADEPIIDKIAVQLEDWDIVVVVAYFAAVIAVAVWSSCRNRGSTTGYFLAGRSMHFIPVGASLFASNIGSGHFVGLAGSGASGGIGIAVFELNAIFILLFLGWVFVPVYIAAGVFTMPEYLRKRFGGQRIRVYLAVLALLLYIFTKISADLYSGAIFLQQAIGLDIWTSAMVLLAIACVFTIIGGLTAVIWTDFIQTIIMLAGAFVLMGLSFAEVEKLNPDAGFTNTFEAVVDQYFAAADPYYVKTNTTCGLPPADAMHFFRSLDWSNDLPWVGVLFGAVISSVWYWCSDQVIVQRALASKNLSHARAGTVLAGFLKFLPLFIMVMPGMVARILFPDLVGCVDPEKCKAICGTPGGCTNIAYPLLVVNVMPIGVRGLMIAVMMSALVSSLTSVFNSSSTIFTMDIWKRFRPHASETEQLIVGRVFVLVLVGVSVAWIPIVQNFSQLFQYIQQVTSYLAPPICAVYILAVFVKRTNEQGAFWGLMVGLMTGLTRFALELAYSAPPCGEVDTRPDIIRGVHYLHFGMLLFGIVVIVTLVISLLTAPLDERHLVRLTYSGRFEKGDRLDMSISEDIEAPEDEKNGHTNAAYLSEKDQLETAFTSEAKEKDGQPISSTPIATPPLKWYRVAINWLCGIENVQNAEVLTKAQKKALDEKNMAIKELPLHRKLNNCFAVVLMVLATFLWGFFA